MAEVAGPSTKVRNFLQSYLTDRLELLWSMFNQGTNYCIWMKSDRWGDSLKMIQNFPVFQFSRCQNQDTGRAMGHFLLYLQCLALQLKGAPDLLEMGSTRYYPALATAVF